MRPFIHGHLRGAIAASFAKILRWLALPFGKVEPLYFGLLKYGCPEPRVFRASQSTLLASPLLIRVSEAPARSVFIYTGLRV